MDASYEFDSERRVVIVTVHGELTDQDLLAGYDRLVNDPRFRPEYDQLVDLRGVSGEKVSAQGVRVFAARPPEFASTSRRAIVIRTDLGLGMGRMFEILRGGESGEVRVFKELDAAKEWLRIK